MPAADPLYDLIVMLDSASPEEQRAKVLATVEQTIGSAGLVNTQDWGVRQTAYEIGHKTDAEYHLLQFHGVRETLEKLQRFLKFADAVTRFRIIKLKPGTPAPPTTRAEPRPTGIVDLSAAEAAPAPEPEPVATVAVPADDA